MGGMAGKLIAADVRTDLMEYRSARLKGAISKMGFFRLSPCPYKLRLGGLKGETCVI